MILRIGLCLVFSLATATSSNAQVGELAEVKSAAREQKEPKYHADLMVELNKKLNSIVHAKRIKAPKQQLLWSLTISGVLLATYDAVHKVGYNDITSSALYVAADTVWKAMIADNQEAADAAKKAAHDAIFNAAVQGVKGKSWEAENGLMAFEIATWLVLNWLLENIDRVIEHTYGETEKVLEDDIEKNPFENHAKLVQFIDAHFGDLSSEAMRFVAPWLEPILSNNQVPQMHRELFSRTILGSFWRSIAAVLPGREDETSAFHGVPNDVIFFILKRPFK